MQFQIPRAKPQVDRGATIQQSVPPIPAVQQPDQARYAIAANAARFLVAAVVAIHQGPTVQPTHPTPPVTTRAEFRYYAPDINRYVSSLTGPRAQVDQGATQLATVPVPPVVSNPPAHYYLYDPNRVLVGGGNVGPDPQFDGATSQPWFIYPVKQPEFKYYTPDPNRLTIGGGNMGPDPQVDGATRQATFIFPVSQPEAAYRVPLARSVAQTGPQPQLLGVTITVAQTSIFPPNQPEASRFSAQHAIRFVVDAPRQADQGATVQPSFVFVPNQPEAQRYAGRELARALGGPTPQLAGPTVQDWFVYPLSEPIATVGRQQPVAAPRLDVLAVVVATDVYPVSQPELLARLRLERARQLGGAAVQTTGATTQATFIFPTSQPDASRFAVREVARAFGGPVPQTAGATIQAWFIYPTTQPELRRYTLPDPHRSQTIGPRAQFEGATIDTGSYLFPIVQFDRRYAVPDVNRHVAELGPRRQLSGATTHQTFVFPVNQAEFSYYRRVTPSASVLPVLGIVAPSAQPFECLRQPDWRMYPTGARYQTGTWLPAADVLRASDIIDLQGSVSTPILLDAASHAIVALPASASTPLLLPATSAARVVLAASVSTPILLEGSTV